MRLKEREREGIAMEKRLSPKKIIRVDTPSYPDSVYCPNCFEFLGFITNKHKNFCDNCGQALKYKEEE